MKCQFILVGAMCFSLLLPARGETPDEKYVQIYNLIQEADGLNESGQSHDAALKYLEAQKGLKTLQSDYPGWNGNVITFRLGYIAGKIEPLAQKAATATATNAAPPVLAQEASPAAPATNQMRELQDEIKRLTVDNARLELRLKEALSVQPAPLDPRELAKAEEQIKLLQKEKELLKVSLEQAKAKPAAPGDPAVLEQERQIVTEVKQKLAEQIELAMTLQRENESLKRQLAGTKPGQESGDLALQLQAARGTISALQSSNLNLLTEQLILESRVSDLAKRVSRRGTRSSSRPEPQNQQLEIALARLAVYESKPVPLTPEERAVSRPVDLKASIVEANPIKRTVKELPPGAGPIMEEAQRAIDAGRYDEAEKKLLDVLRQDERNIYVLGNLAAVQIDQNRLPEAEKTITQALAIDPRDPACLYTLGLLNYRQQKYDAALDALSLSASLVPEKARTQFVLGLTLIEKGNRTAAEAALRKAVQLKPDLAEAHFSLARVYATQQPPFKELAQWHYQKALGGGYPHDLQFEKLLEEKGSP